MKIQFRILGLVCITCALLLVQPLQAQVTGEQNIIYQNSFTTNPGWQTNNPSSNYWDPNKAMYHYSIEPSTGNYAYVTVDYDRGPFTLEYDLLPEKTDEAATFRLGFGSKEMDRSKNTIVLSEFTNGKNGKLMYLRVITPGSKLVSVASGQGEGDTPCYGGYKDGKPDCGPTVRFEDNKTYHVALKYDQAQKQVSMAVSEKNTGRQIWSYYVNTWEDLAGMNRIFLGSVGDYGIMGRYASGYIDNVKLYTESTVTATPTGVTSLQTTVPVTYTTRPTPRPTTMLPTPTPTPTSPPSPLFTLAALGVAGAVFCFKKIRPRP
jgi:hypothetical protein